MFIMKKSKGLKCYISYLTRNIIRLLRFVVIVIFVAISTSSLGASVQQQREISGKVTDSSGSPLPGVSVVIKGTTQGTVTNTDGEFSLRIPGDAEILQFSFIGMKMQEVAIEGRTTFTVSMEEVTTELEEVVAVGYGQQSMISTSAAISSVSGEKLEGTSLPTMGEAISGKLAGVATVQTTGQPGVSDPSIYLRGIGTLNNATPLVVIDGVETEMRDFMQLNSSDIAGISILKDASSTAVYGVKGANGVIIVTTKTGVVGRTKITGDFSYGLQVPTKIEKQVNAYEWTEYYNEVKRNDDELSSLIPPEAQAHYLTQDYPLIWPDVNFNELFFGNTAGVTRANVNLSGGTEKVKYFSSVGMYKQNGLLKFANTSNFDYTRATARTNLDINVTPTTTVHFKSDVRIGNQKVPRQTSANLGYGYIWLWINGAPPLAEPDIYEGKVVRPLETYSPWNGYQSSVLQNLYGSGYTAVKEDRMNISMELNQKLGVLSPVLEGLTFRTKVNFKGGFNQTTTFNDNKLRLYNSMFNIDAAYPDPALSDSTVVLDLVQEAGPSSYSRGYRANRSIYMEAGLDYQRTFGNVHNVDALLLYNQGKNFYHNLAFPGIPTGYVGLVGRARYNYNRQYMIEFNVGYNGSENFARNKRFGLFPSVSGAWVVSEESFMQGVTFLDYLKLRASYGLVGTDNAGSQARFIYIGDEWDRSPGQYYGYNFGDQLDVFLPGVVEGSKGNEDVSWETAAKQNYGVDMALFNRSINLSVDYFYEYRDNILIPLQSAPTWLAVDLPVVNKGVVENKGFEVQLGWQSHIGKLNFDISGNIGHAVNTVIFRDEVPPLEPYQAMTGHPIGTQFGYIWEGFYTEEEIALIAEGELAKPTADVQAGDNKYSDLNGDLVIDNADRRPFGYPTQPQVYGGVNAYFNYKGFDLYLGFQGAAQVSRNMGWYYSSPMNGRGDGPVLRETYLYHWTPENVEKGIVKYPRASFKNNAHNSFGSTFWNRNSSYLRLKNVELGYTFGLKHLGIKQIRAYVKANNVFTITKKEYELIDPERNPIGPAGYPLIKLYEAGLTVSF